MQKSDELNIASSRVAATELVAALTVAAVFGGLGWLGWSFRGAAAYMPVTISLLGMFSALVWAVQAARCSIAAKGSITLSKTGLWRLILMIMFSVCYIIAIPYLGFLTSTLILMTTAPIALGLRPLWQAILASVILTLLLWLVFVVILDNTMPHDIIFSD